MMSPDRYVGVHPNASADVRMLAVGHGENAARPWHRHRLAESKGKDCDRQPHQYADVQHMNEGRHDGMTTKYCVARELTLMSIMLAEFS